MALTSITKTPLSPPVDAVVTLAKAKKHLRVETDYTDDDELIQDYIDAAIMAAEDYISGHVYNKAVTMVLDALATNVVFEIFPVRSITSVEYIKEGDDTYTVIPTEDYYLRNKNLRVQEIVFKTLPQDVAEQPDVVKIVVQSGYVNTTNTPKPIKQAVLLMVGDAYEYREDRKEVVTKCSEHLLRPYRNYV